MNLEQAKGDAKCSRCGSGGVIFTDTHESERLFILTYTCMWCNTETVSNIDTTKTTEELLEEGEL